MMHVKKDKAARFFKSRCFFMHPNACAQGIIIELPLKSQGQRKNGEVRIGDNRSYRARQRRKARQALTA